jgi:hypothetical protein
MSVDTIFLASVAAHTQVAGTISAEMSGEARPQIKINLRQEIACGCWDFFGQQLVLRSLSIHYPVNVLIEAKLTIKSVRHYVTSTLVLDNAQSNAKSETWLSLTLAAASF